MQLNQSVILGKSAICTRDFVNHCCPLNKPQMFTFTWKKSPDSTANLPVLLYLLLPPKIMFYTTFGGGICQSPSLPILPCHFLSPCFFTFPINEFLVSAKHYNRRITYMAHHSNNKLWGRDSNLQMRWLRPKMGTGYGAPTVIKWWAAAGCLPESKTHSPSTEPCYFSARSFPEVP